MAHASKIMQHRLGNRATHDTCAVPLGYQTVHLSRSQSGDMASVLRHWWVCVFVLPLVLGLAGCKDKDKDTRPRPQQPKPAPQKVVEQAPPEPLVQDIRTQLLPLLADFPMVKLGEVQMSCSPQEDGSVLVTASATINVEENLYRKEDAPPVFNVDRKEVNTALNRAMLPEASYLLQVGADSLLITDEDRAPKPLPPELQQQADALKHLAESPVYRLNSPVGTSQVLPASMRARKKGNRWEMSEVSFDTAPLSVFQMLIPERALPKDAAVVSDNFEATQRARIRELVEAFNTAAKPYIEGREAAARSRVLEAQARKEEDEKVRNEQAESLRLRREAWEKACTSFLQDSAAFTGEWKRADSFGKLTLRISEVATFPDAVHFIGTLLDTNLPEAAVDVVGRCQPASKDGEPIPCLLRIYGGRYEPDVPTAEVFDKHDAIMRLSLSPEDGTLSGCLTCESWKDSPDKDFQVHFQPAPQKPASAPKNKRRGAER